MPLLFVHSLQREMSETGGHKAPLHRKGNSRSAIWMAFVLRSFVFCETGPGRGLLDEMKNNN